MRTDRFATDDLLIRGWRPGDGAALFEAVQASKEHLRPWLPWPDFHESPQDSETYCERQFGKWLLEQDFALGIWTSEGTLLGGAGFHDREGFLLHANAEVGMWVREDRAASGVGTRALVALTRWAFSSDWEWERLIWRCDTRNQASSRVASKAGYGREGLFRRDRKLPDGTRRDTEVWIAHRGEWSPPR